MQADAAVRYEDPAINKPSIQNFHLGALIFVSDILHVQFDIDRVGQLIRNTAIKPTGRRRINRHTKLNLLLIKGIVVDICRARIVGRRQVAVAPIPRQARTDFIPVVEQGG